MADKLKMKTSAYVWNTYEHPAGPMPISPRGYYVTKTPGVDVAYLPITASNTGEEQRARAMLYSAAPALLAALEGMLAAAKCNYDPRVALSEYGAQAEAAIAQAKGG